MKPANEGRGYGLAVGKVSDPESWRRACAIDPDMPKVIQEHVEPVLLPVTKLQGDTPQRLEMYLTLGLAMLGGKFQGLLSRISTNRVTNISQSGMVQAVFLTDSNGASA